MPASLKTVVKACLLAVVVMAPPSGGADTLLFYNEPMSPEGGRPLHQSLLGWTFFPTTAITITHLGLFDDYSDGFDIAHPIGLFRLDDGAELASGVVSAGLVDPLVDEFRYVDVPDVTLVSGVEYVLSYYTNDPEGISYDYQAFPLGLGVGHDPAIALGYSRVQSGAPGLGIPSIQTFQGAYFVGPNALFTVVPIPGAVWMFASALATIGIARRRRSRL
ncbi:MAG: hypothetical protein R3F24_07610 [Gammaproteobacteria bacterium]